MIDVKYKKGCLHGDADGFSRPEVEGQMAEPLRHNAEHLALNAITRSMTQKTTSVNQNDMSSASSTTGTGSTKQPLMTFDFGIERIREEQKKDINAQQTVKNIRHESSYIIENTVLYKLASRPRARTNLKLIYIPSSMRTEVLASYHDYPTAAHFGSRRTWTKLKDRCYWPKMHGEVESYIRLCEKCAKFNIKRTKTPGKLNPIPLPEGPMELVGMDFWGPTRQEFVNGNKYVLVVTDYLTKFIVAKALPYNTAQTTAQTFVEEFIFNFGVPNRLITDQAVHFNNELMKNVAELISFDHIKATP
ncbi:unnamed protein product [Didymodactylos carnosus]|uniref:Integrase catalytic domain-containing protein n=1 Tax=Didymodactylos carnosus TaxID=1234261 RepID=A0A8S2DXE2_9BILA|nr:unnamed protein product [Didymodactylos carnosus]CAF3794791.1 unnamed protein product [Didymodactylos carnosus]